MKKSRLEQCYLYVVNELNKMGIKPDGRELQPWAQALAERISEPSDVEVQTILIGFVAEGVQYHATTSSAGKLAQHPKFKGFDLGSISGEQRTNTIVRDRIAQAISSGQGA